MRTPMAKQAIDALIASVSSMNAQEISKKLFLVRNGLTHGRRLQSIEADLGSPLTSAANTLAEVLFRIIIQRVMPKPSAVLNFSSFNDEVCVGTVRASAVGSFSHSGPGEHPTEDQIPSMSISMITSFNQDQGKADGP